ncbi:hypothetical protein XELAEV_18027621mg [Xenopus laevis]|uniref:EF-hand domain-containing protein n=1 Tax=Xenopus laevis TaxID=8355 RepID=A0A974CXX1_XENLA|nr:hypothetical protein XELAEV_18027621mg [Xenopus laevis]
MEDGSEEARHVAEFIENRLSIKDFGQIQRLFQSPELNQSECMSREEFMERTYAAVGHGIKEEYGELFDKIDVSREGFIDWDKLTSFMLLELNEKDERVKSSVIPQWKDIRSFPLIHKENIQKIVYLKGLGCYVSLSKDGLLGVWGEHLKLQRSLQICTDTVKLKDLWATSLVFLANVNKIAVSFTRKEICFYDLNSKQDLFCQYKLYSLQGYSWTTVSYSSHLKAFLSCSTSDNNTVVLAWREKGKTHLRTTSLNISKGINGFDYHPEVNVISLETGSTITFWMIDPGQKIKQFSGCHGTSEISTMAHASQVRSAGRRSLSSPSSGKHSCSAKSIYNANSDSTNSVTRLFFLGARRNTLATGGSNLVSYGGSRYVRLWNIFRNHLMAEFVAHEGAGSIIMTVDKTNQYIITGDLDGWLKDYYIDYSEKKTTESPQLVTSFQPHSDCVTHLETCTHSTPLLILSASTDCTIYEEHWSIEKCLHEKENNMCLNIQKEIQATLTTWNQNCQQHIVMRQQNRVTLSSCPLTEDKEDLPFKTKEKLHSHFRKDSVQNSVGTFMLLNIDFVGCCSSLKSVFDEGSLFPREMLERELQAKQPHAKLRREDKMKRDRKAQKKSK